MHRDNLARSHRPTAGRLRVLGALVTVTALAGLAGCGGDAGNPVASVNAPADDSGYRGTVLSQPVDLSDAAASVELPSTSGGTTTLGDLQRGHVMLVYFGYTHCPDVCPTTMADIATALRQAPDDVQKQTQVVFVTSDPERDTVPVMSAWLAHFDSGLPTPFVGLTGSLDQVDSSGGLHGRAAVPAGGGAERLGDRGARGPDAGLRRRSGRRGLVGQHGARRLPPRP